MSGGNGSTHLTPYVELQREAWAALGTGVSNPLSDAEVESLRGLNDALDLDEVEQVYLPLSKLLSLYVEAAAGLYAAQEAFLARPFPERTPFVIGLAGSVAVGKSTVSRVLRQMLAHWPQHPNVALVTTDGFLFPNAELERRGLLERKGFPESYDRRGLLRFVQALKSGQETVTAPVYSHQRYDIVPDKLLTISHPDIVIVEGLNVLQPASASAHRDGRESGRERSSLAVSDFFDFTIYVDADPRDIERWYVDRFLRLREVSFANPASYHHKYAALPHDEAVAQATTIWQAINGPNLSQNILPTRARADLVLRKAADHSVEYVRLRRL